MERTALRTKLVEELRQRIKNTGILTCEIEAGNDTIINVFKYYEQGDVVGDKTEYVFIVHEICPCCEPCAVGIELQRYDEKCSASGYITSEDDFDKEINEVFQDFYIEDIELEVLRYNYKELKLKK